MNSFEVSNGYLNICSIGAEHLCKRIGNMLIEKIRDMGKWKDKTNFSNSTSWCSCSALSCFISSMRISAPFTTVSFCLTASSVPQGQIENNLEKKTFQMKEKDLH